MDLTGLLQFAGRRRLERAYAKFAGSNQRTAPSSETTPVGTQQLSLRDLPGHGLVVGATGGGKTTAVISILDKSLREVGPRAFGVVDPKGDLFNAARALVARAPEALAPIVVDFTAQRPTSYGLLSRRDGETEERLVDRRMEVFDDVLGRENQASLRMSRMLRNTLWLAVEHGVSFPLIEFLLVNSEVLHGLGIRSRNERVANYFRNEYGRERESTALALLARLDFLLRTESIRLSLGSDRSIDFCDVMDCGRPLLINVGGPMLPRHTSKVIQSVILSDLREATFRRQRRDAPYPWFFDEAQLLMDQPSDERNLTDILTMARSFGVNVVLMTQSMKAASPSPAFLRQLETNTKWLLLFRSSSEDARIIEAGLRATGNVPKERDANGKLTYLTETEEIRNALRDIGSLRTGHAYLWLREGSHPVREVHLPQVDCGSRLPRSAETLAENSPAEIEANLHAQARRLRESVGAAASGDRSARRNLEAVFDRLDKALGEDGRHGA